MAKRPPSQELDQYQLRLPAGMRKRLKAMSEASGPSMNSEIVAAIEAHLAAAEGSPPPFSQLVEQFQNWQRQMAATRETGQGDGTNLSPD